jgi:hypothetical protein
MDALTPDLTAQELLEAEGYEDVLVLASYSYDTALVGVTECGRAVYDYDRMVEWLRETAGFTLTEAIEWIDYNMIRALEGMGPKAPIIMHRLRGD